MPLNVDHIMGRPGLSDCIRHQSRSLLHFYERNPRHAAVFATQQRLLMAHAGLALYFTGASHPVRGLLASHFQKTIAEYAVASHNTADAFLKEMLHYQIIRHVPGAPGKRSQPLEPAEATLAAVADWLTMHLATLDALDGGARVKIYAAYPQMLERVQPGIAYTLLSSNAVRKPERTFSLFTWLNNGGTVMDRLIAGIAETDPEAERVPTSVMSVTEIAGWLRLSRTHLARKLREAEELGSLGWEGQRGHSVMWVSREFKQEYVRAQAVKLAIIDAAFEACVPKAEDPQRETE